MTASPPIFVFEQVDLYVFADAQAACDWIEPRDVAVYEVFDVSGASIPLRIDGARRGWFALDVGNVVRDGRVAGPDRRDRFRVLLNRHVEAVGADWYGLAEVNLGTIPLHDFAQSVAQRMGFTQ